MKYTDDQIAEAVKVSVSITDVMRKMGISYISGGMHAHISKRIKGLKLETSHFTGRASNRGKAHKGGPDKKSWQEVMVVRTNGRREAAFRLRRVMIESGMKYQCVCGLEDIWQGKEIRLQVNHISGDPMDCRKENLEFLCPNCHSQTEKWSRRVGGKSLCGLTSTAEYDRVRRKKKNGLVAERNTRSV